MPSRQAHLDQADANEKLAQEFEKSGVLDWAVTLLFYAMVHRVEAYLAGHGVHSLDHADRDRNIAQYVKDTAFRTDYADLSRRSRAARYTCWDPQPHQFALVKGIYQDLRRSIQGQLSQP